MKRFAHTIMSLLLALILCLSLSMTAFASDSGTESELSLEDFLSLFSSLNGTDEENPDDVEGSFTDYTLNDISFSVPSDWVESEEDGGLSFYAPTFTTFVNTMYESDEDNEINIFDEDQLQELEETMGDDNTDIKMEYVTVCGYAALWIEAALEESDMEAMAYSLILPVDDAVFVLSLTNLGAGGIDDFAGIVESIRVAGTNEETDLYPVYDGSTAFIPSSDPLSSPDTTVLPEGSEEGLQKSASEEIDASDQSQIVLLDNDMCTVTVNNIITDDEYYAMSANIFLDNKSDLNLYFSFDQVSVNGYMCDPFWGTSVSSGHKSNSDFHFYHDDFDANGIETVRDIEFTLLVRDDDDWFADPIAEKSFIIYPNGPDVPEQEPQEFDDNVIVLLDNDDCTMILKGFEEDSFYFKADLYLENKTDKAIDFSVSGSTSVNRYEMNPYFIKTVQPGKKANTSVNWFQDDLSSNGIETVEQIEFDISISDSEDWFADPLYTTTQTVQVQ